MNNEAFTADSPIEWPTWLLVIGVFTSWFLLMQHYHQLGPIVAAPLLVIVCTLYGSLCHELIHGHPTRNPGVNALIGSVPFGLFLPYDLYRDSHLQHHQDEYITIPGKDPESYYCSAGDYQCKSSLAKGLATFNMTVAGRLLINPAVEIWGLMQHATRGILTRDIKSLRVWCVHALSVTLLLLLVTQYFRVPVWHYVVIAYFSSSMTRIRSFYEHRARSEVSERTVLMEPGRFFRFLFLNLNYHLAHHENPSIPWYQLGKFYQANRSELIARSGNFHYQGYSQWLFGFLLRPVDSPVHPFYQVPGESDPESQAG